MMKLKTILPLFLSALALIFVGGVVLFNTTSTAQTATNTSPTTVDATKEQVAVNTTTTVPPVTSTQSSKYKDGTYTSTGSYQTPESTEQLAVTLTLKNNIVTNASVFAQAREPQSARYQSIFEANYKQYVIGKNIDTLSLSHVSGSSLTSGGFNKAVAQIRAQAQS